MIRHFFFLAASLLALSAPAPAQEMSAIARVDAAQSGVQKGWFGGAEFSLHLSQGVPYRVFTLADPPRLVMDFREVDWSGVRADDLSDGRSPVHAVRFGAFQPGWSRLVADLSDTYLPDEIGMTLDEASGRAVLNMDLARVSEEVFAAKSGVPDSTLWPQDLPEGSKPSGRSDRFVVVIDPGHGGIDPGAERENVNEKELMLKIALDLREALLRAADVDVVLTRESDVFVSLRARVAIAHRAGGDLFLSLHADALSQGGAEGATVYTLSDEASDTASAHLAARHNRADIIAGADLTGADDEVAGVLLDLARQETAPRSEALARSIVAGLDEVGGPMNNRPLRQAGFSVLKSADIPSALVEVGFLSSPRDLANLRDPVWRAAMVDGLVAAILAWRDADEAKRPLVQR
ncbi:N-acetylmuramoyl-L-alanine amidase [Roseobacter cerasinus]|uniref:N-acetylmuramoyl-L-alanine amidase n=1 Tax=Roseobacter cerasinus TaxID=2602289 RepID=A0A640VQK5_9RHOB|nr:N-acetylmuramoyl-L-alanine amidase [Roseobacter cerasinus]GFE50299.1 N-acetylmuramoyl-L-alanine amidase [Roseobacter cerasinus]